MNLKSFLTTILAISMFLPVYAQEKKQAIISGTITDARSKSPVYEAVITVSSSAFKGQKFAITDSTGTYRINNLPAGSYTISFEMEGYEKYSQDNIALQEGGSVAINHQLVKQRGRGRKIN